ncbi:TIGR04222 domain-containing membrane protein [Bremerella sp. T1]|uniref:TIGR04222 domain-containing membrane protein n=1 Tax=Bremerella sp. TYQ1 TaxID=3119568 RepID=UPI001CCBBCE2|nr:TIGR04222 domain-containing membrane protein [Bremerella volcania]UBM35769.1 TIGR04222 domain-containing membrane protein [Bremerella volcania]
MDFQAEALWNKIEAFTFDDEGTTLTFAARLARENGWRLGYAQRVVDEYRRFVFLSMVAGHAVSPCEAVDQAWHLHLTYTHSYWQKLCEEILPRPLHHVPTTGRTEEAGKFEDWYSKTLESYERFFKHAPPSDIWPPPGKQMESVVDSRWVNVRDYFVIPRNPLNWFALLLLVVLPLLSIGGCQAEVAGDVTPFDFDGVTFLKFYAMVAGVSFVLAVMLRWMIPISEPPIPVDVSDPNLAAYLAHGPKGLVLATIAKLLQEKKLEMAEGSYNGGRVEKQLIAVNTSASNASTLERHILREANSTGKDNLKKVIANSVPIAKEMGAKLTEMGLFEPNPFEPTIRRWLPSLILLGIALFGFVKMGIGIAREKPFLFVAIMAAAVLVASIWLAIRKGRTPRGDAILADWQHKHAHLNPAAPGTQINTPDDYFLATGLFGIFAFSSGDLYPLAQEYRQEQNSFWGGYGAGCSSGCGDGGSGCGSSCGSGCGSGCGGCGS